MEPFTPKELRCYSRFLYQHIHRFDYGWKDSKGNITRVPKDRLLRAKACKSYRGMERLTERHLRSHLAAASTYYYTGQRSKGYLLLCIDIDAHEDQTDAWDVCKFLAHWYFDDDPKRFYSESSTGGHGVHLYFRIACPDFISTPKLHSLFTALSSQMRDIVSEEGYEANICDIYGLPSIWSGDGHLAKMIKLPRPASPAALQALVSLSVLNLTDLSLSIQTVQDEHPNKEPIPIPSPPMPLPIIPPSVSSPMTVVDTTKHGDSKVSLGRVKTLNLDEIRSRNPYYRAAWTIRTMANILNRPPQIEEALAAYDELELGTGVRTQARIQRFEQALAYNREHFDPNKRRSFSRLYPAIFKLLQNAVDASPGISLIYGKRRHRMSLESLAVGYYFATYKIGRLNDGTLPIAGVVGLAKKLHADGAIEHQIENQRASSVRRLLVELGLLQLEDEKYVWGRGKGRGTAKKYSLRRAGLGTTTEDCGAAAA